MAGTWNCIHTLRDFFSLLLLHSSSLKLGVFLGLFCPVRKHKCYEHCEKWIIVNILSLLWCEFLFLWASQSRQQCPNSEWTLNVKHITKRGIYAICSLWQNCLINKLHCSHYEMFHTRCEFIDMELDSSSWMENISLTKSYYSPLAIYHGSNAIYHYTRSVNI